MKHKWTLMLVVAVIVAAAGFAAPARADWTVDDVLYTVTSSGHDNGWNFIGSSGNFGSATVGVDYNSPDDGNEWVTVSFRRTYTKTGTPDPLSVTATMDISGELEVDLQGSGTGLAYAYTNSYGDPHDPDWSSGDTRFTYVGDPDRDLTENDPANNAIELTVHPDPPQQCSVEINETSTLHVVIGVWSKGELDQIGIAKSTSDGTVSYSNP